MRYGSRNASETSQQAAPKVGWQHQYWYHAQDGEILPGEYVSYSSSHLAMPYRKRILSSRLLESRLHKGSNSAIMALSVQAALTTVRFAIRASRLPQRA